MKRYSDEDHRLVTWLCRVTHCLNGSAVIRLFLRQSLATSSSVVADVDKQFIEAIDFTEKASALAEKYITAGVIGAAKRVDAQHIATATVHRVDVLVSWNFRHIVNLNRIRGFNSVNLRNGYPMLEIRTPWEVLSYGEESEDD